MAASPTSFVEQSFTHGKAIEVRDILNLEAVLGKKRTDLLLLTKNEECMMQLRAIERPLQW